MKPVIPIVAALFTLLPAIAHADDKAEAILKEVRLRMSKATTYTANILASQNSSQKPRLRLFLQQPDKTRLEFTENGSTRVMVLHGKEAALIIDGKAVPTSPTEARNVLNALYYLISASFEKITDKSFTVTYVTQKMLDEKTVVDVIDVTGAKSSGTMRLYIDNNSLLRKVVSSGSSTIMLFTEIVVDEPIPASKFALK